jgi:hypothetical protein
VPSKALATIGSGPMRRVLAVSLPTFRRFAERHGYHLVVGDGDSFGRPAAWAKVPLLKDLLERFELVLWLDADAVVVDGTGDIAAALPATAYQGLVRHVSSRTGRELPNTGVWLLRSGERSGAFLDAVWDSGGFIYHKWWENAAVLHLLGYSVDDPGWRVRDSGWLTGTCWLPGEWNRVTWQGRQAPTRIRHYAGVPNRERILYMRGDLHEAAASQASLVGSLASRARSHGWHTAGWVYRVAAGLNRPRA